MKKLKIKNLTFSNMQPLIKNPMISKGYVDICYSGKNRNKSYISEEVMKEKLQPSVLGVPIVGEYFKEKDDFGDHGGKVVIDSNGIRYEATTIPYGFVPPNSNLSYIEKLDKDNVTRKYLRADCFLWTGQYPECDRVIKTGNPQSMELERDTGYWKRIDGEEYYVIEDAVISKLCILGTDVEPCFEGASFGENSDNQTKVSYSLDREQYDDFIKNFALQIKEALKYENDEGGQSMKKDEENKEKTETFEKEESVETTETFEKEEDKEEETKETFEKKEEDKEEETKEQEIEEEETEKDKKSKEPNTDSACSTDKKKKYELDISEMTTMINNLTMSLKQANETITNLEN